MENLKTGSNPHS